jgi:hypothetical protein
VYVIAHIGNIPVEEWLPFLVPVLALYLFGRHRNRQRRQALAQLPEAGEALDDGTVDLVLARWTEANHQDLSPAHVPLMYPPGPDGLNASQLAERIRAEPAVVERLLDDLADLGYLDLGEANAHDGPRAWLTFEGYELFYKTEDALLSRSADPGAADQDERASADS